MEPLDASQGDLEGLVTVTCQFDRLQGVLRFLIHSQRSLSSNVTQLFNSLSVVDKFKGDQKALQEVMKEILDRTGTQADQIQNLQEATAQMRHTATTQEGKLESLGVAVDNQSDQLASADR
jgi:division protein CdvB (Snf7/Vps24/ESCRT-III family)